MPPEMTTYEGELESPLTARRLGREVLASISLVRRQSFVEREGLKEMPVVRRSACVLVLLSGTRHPDFTFVGIVRNFG